MEDVHKQISKHSKGSNNMSYKSSSEVGGNTNWGNGNVKLVGDDDCKMLVKCIFHEKGDISLNVLYASQIYLRLRADSVFEK